MTIKVGINGFGRIGRLVTRAISEYNIDDVQIVAINSPGNLETSAHLLKYDSVHGRFQEQVTTGEGFMMIGDNKVRMTHERNPADINWGELDVDVVMECSGVFRTKERAMPHIEAGAKSILISAPADGVDKTIVYGVNHQELAAADLIVSNASCTTNCLAPVAKVLDEALGIVRGTVNTVHAMTGDQAIIDARHNDPRRGRAAAESLVPTSTGAAKAIGEVLPQLAGRLHGTAVRVPTATVSMIDLVFNSGKRTTVEEVNALFAAAAQDPAMGGALAYNDRLLVSVDFKGHPASAIFDATQTSVLDGDMVRVVAWYDNEWAFAERMIDTAASMMALRAETNLKQAA